MNSTTAVSIRPKTETEILHFLVNFSLHHDLPLAFWRLPESNTSYVILANESLSIKKDSALEDLPPGFMFAPFDRQKESLFLPADYIFAFENEELKTPSSPSASTAQSWLEEQWKKSPALRADRIRLSFGSGVASGANYIELVRKGVEAIHDGVVQKVVPSRTKTVNLADDFNLIRSILNLKKKYAHALISFVSIPGVGHWLGATPETLVSVENKTIFRTVALAGTLPFQEGMHLKNVAWTQKEIEEQALVERYIISCFKKIRVREYDEVGPKTVVAGNLLHLKSDFMVDMKAINFPQLGSVMLQLLHPTSAVCGMPLDPAIEFLKKHEGYDREFYSGYLGPVQIENNIHLFVNLRCMKLLDGKATLFAGAGVTIDSVPEKELEETEIKFKTLLNVIG